MYALIDCNSFFASCERLFRPDLIGKPIIVLSNNDGCIIARSKEAKQFDIPMCAPFFKVKNICEKNEVAVFSSNFSLYTNLSDRVMQTLSMFTPRMEVYSVDEAFLDLDGITSRNYERLGREIKYTVEKNVGIPVSVGIAPTKTLSKAANFVAKKNDRYNGVCELSQKFHQDDLLASVPIGDVWGIGKSLALKARGYGMNTARDFRDFKNEKLILSVFTKVGLQRKQELMGIPCFELETKINKKKEISVSRTFESTIHTRSYLKEAVSCFMASAASKLREQRSVCGSVEVFFRTNPHNDSMDHYASSQKKVPVPTADTMKLIKIAMELVDEEYKLGYLYKKAGVRLGDFFDEDHYQVGLFESGDGQKSKVLMELIDTINGAFGKTLISPLACGVGKAAYKMARSFKSPDYLTNWSDLPKVV
ncbi:MAG: hypothetical protein A2381_15855 [Bdellovibrionales bacterium RIFOXYB1_FULL_37_110]|nr:MAG: hypothetical protein A2417_07705 [Bdellovibrionales bacterium RIFOXYC1_FULL_37_79]OFZ57089.1 MAG: hypothetical protein A2381_15855 [Bdellovibrionales bacterium RIFOXYB1_FULL_37_110]OFZ62060.1 MAG: hypothetical protein A2577_08375 [Bdellovibrionales bacterium RIFOXYD1_FULL_36_51]